MDVYFNLNKQAELDEDIDYNEELRKEFGNSFSFCGEPTNVELESAGVDPHNVLNSIGFFSGNGGAPEIVFLTREIKTVENGKPRFSYRLESFLSDEDYSDIYDEMCRFVEQIHEDLD